MHERLRFVPDAIEGAGETIDLHKLRDFFLRRWKVMLASVVVVTAATLLFLTTLTPRYSATSQLLLNPQKERILSDRPATSEPSLEAPSIDSQIVVIGSIELLRRVVEREKLTQDAEFGQAEKPGLFDLFLNFLRNLARSRERTGEGDDLHAAGSIPPDVLDAIFRLQHALDVKRVEKTYVISITVTSKNAAKAARLANAVANAYTLYEIETRFDTAKRVAAWFAERRAQLAEEVRKSDEAVDKFRRDNNLIAVTSEGKATISEQQQTELNVKLIAARADTVEKRAKYLQAQAIQGKRGNIEAIPDVVHSPVVSALRSQQAEVTRKEAELLSRFSDQHPMVINARAERRDIDRSIAAEVARVVSNLKNDYEVAKAREDSLQKSLSHATGTTGVDNNVGVRLRELERVNTVNKALFEELLSRAKRTQEQLSFEERDATVISPATTPSDPSFPKKASMGMLAAVFGLLLGIGGAVGLDLLNSGFTTAREIENVLKVPVLASIPLLSTSGYKPFDQLKAMLHFSGGAEGKGALQKRVLAPPGYVLAKPLSRYAEAIRAIRIGVRMADVDNPPKVVLVTSSVPDEGKSAVAISLAFSALISGQKALLIDGDLRRPGCSKFFGLGSALGLVDYLAGTISLREAIVSIKGLSVLPGGSKSTHPPDFLESERMRQMVSHLRELYDYIVIDSPPVNPVIDAQVLGNLADKVVYVVKWQGPTRELVSDSFKRLNMGRKIAGVVLNQIDESKNNGAYGYTSKAQEKYNSYYEG